MFARKSVDLAMFSLSFFAFFLLAAPGAQAQERRIALVIGNGDYQQLSALANPVRDAEAIGQSLSALGFTVFLTTNLGEERFRRAIRFFLSRAENADTKLIYFAGHGATLAGKSYLFPTDFGKDGIYNLREAIALDTLVSAAGSSLGTNLVFVDACRNNPLQSGQATVLGLPATPQTPGTSPRTGTLISFATTPGQVAYDGTGLHSPFTGALLDYLAAPNMDIERMLKRVRRDVVVNTNGLQVPWSESTLLTDFYLAPRRQISASADSEPIPARSNQSLLSALSDTGFNDKPILQKISSGLAGNSVPTAQARASALKTQARSKQIRALLCSVIAPPRPADCAGIN